MRYINPEYQPPTRKDGAYAAYATRHLTHAPLLLEKLPETLRYELSWYDGGPKQEHNILFRHWETLDLAHVRVAAATMAALDGLLNCLVRRRITDRPGALLRTDVGVLDFPQRGGQTERHHAEAYASTIQIATGLREPVARTIWLTLCPMLKHTTAPLPQRMLTTHVNANRIHVRCHIPVLQRLGIRTDPALRSQT